MDLQQALRNIRNMSEHFAEEEILCIRENKEAAIPVLIEDIRDLVANFQDIPDDFDDFDDHTYAMFLLAEFKVHEAFEPLIGMLEFETEKSDWLLGDMLTGDMGQLIASVANQNDIPRIKVVIENRGLDERQRTAALSALLVMYANDKYAKDELFVYLGYLLDTFDNDKGFISQVVYSCYCVCAIEHNTRIFKLYDEDKIDTLFIERGAFDERDVLYTEDIALELLKEDSQYHLIDDTIKSMRWWHCFTNTNHPKAIPQTKTIGRNDPCPCGSGNKYKRCCLNKQG